MRAKIRQILEECIETGIESGYLKAHKHNDNPYAFHIYEQIENAIWLEIDQRFDFERNVCNEVVEGFDQLDELTEALEEAVYLLNPTNEDIHKKMGVYRVVSALDKLKELNT